MPGWATGKMIDTRQTPGDQTGVNKVATALNRTQTPFGAANPSNPYSTTGGYGSDMSFPLPTPHPSSTVLADFVNNPGLQHKPFAPVNGMTQGGSEPGDPNAVGIAPPQTGTYAGEPGAAQIPGAGTTDPTGITGGILGGGNLGYGLPGSGVSGPMGNFTGRPANQSILGTLGDPNFFDKVSAFKRQQDADALGKTPMSDEEYRRLQNERVAAEIAAADARGQDAWVTGGGLVKPPPLPVVAPIPTNVVPAPPDLRRQLPRIPPRPISG